MKKYPKISDAEWQIMKILWDNAPTNSTEIIEVLKNDGNDWSPKTIHTLISRLVKKEALAVKEGTSPKLYYPLVAEADYKREETKNFLEKVYNGSIKMLLANFITDEKLTEEEIKELVSLLDRKQQ